MRTGRIEREWGAEALQPTVGWKVWRVESGLLVSVLYGDPWPVDEPLHAVCVRHDHEAPARACECGIHAGRDLAAWGHYLAVGAESRVFGRVLNKNGAPVSGARVGLMGTSAATLTRANGDFVLDSLPAGNQHAAACYQLDGECFGVVSAVVNASRYWLQWWLSRGV